MDYGTMKKAMLWMLENSGVAAVMQDLPASVDVAIRTGEGKRLLVLTNYGQATIVARLPEPLDDVLNSGKVTTISLQQYGAAVLQ